MVARRLRPTAPIHRAGMAMPVARDADGRFGAMFPRNPGAPLPLPWSVRFRRLYVRSTPEPQVVPAHRHDDLELLLPTSGTWRGAVNGEGVEVSAGGALMVAPGDRHEDRCHHPIALLGVSLELLPGPRPGHSASPLDPACPVADRTLAQSPALHALVGQLEQVTNTGGPWCAMRQDALAQELLVAVLAALPGTALAPVLRERLAASGFAASVASELATYPAGLTVPALAKALGLAERTLQQRCRELLGTTPLALLRRHQLELARELLATGATVQAVAAHLGFANPFHFSTVYKRVFGHPPSATVRKSEGRRSRLAWLEAYGRPHSEA